MDNIKCIHCDLIITKQNISRHYKSEQCIRIQKLLLNKENKYKIEINKQKESIINLIEENNEFKQKILLLETKLKDALDKSEEYRKIVEKSATKTTVKNKYTHNNYLNYISSEPLKISEISKQVKKIVNCDTVMYDDEYFHDHIVDNILKDDNGKDKVLCTDINRKNFSYKDEKSGELVSDPELEKLREQLKKGAKLSSIRKELLENLLKEYEDNGSTGIDPYEKFYEILQKLNFGTPFIEHVAKKTYIKSKSTNSDYEQLLDLVNDE
jgi:hypothetical protein